MATKKAAGSTKNSSGSLPKYLGVKKFGGEKVTGGHIIVRQRGSKFFGGLNTVTGRDFTISSKIEGQVYFHKGYKNRTYVNVINKDKCDNQLLCRLQNKTANIRDHIRKFVDF